VKSECPKAIQDLMVNPSDDVAGDLHNSRIHEAWCRAAETAKESSVFVITVARGAMTDAEKEAVKQGLEKIGAKVVFVEHSRDSVSPITNQFRVYA
jgi:hypothetical protein